MLQDGNCTLYPLLRNSSQTFTDPRWFELVPVQSIAAHTESLATIGGPTCRNKITIVAVALQVMFQYDQPCLFVSFYFLFDAFYVINLVFLIVVALFTITMLKIEWYIILLLT